MFLNLEKYTQPMCKSDCWIQLEMNECNCTISSLPVNENAKLCAGTNSFYCVQQGAEYIFKFLATDNLVLKMINCRKFNFTYDESGFNMNKCLEKCQEACEYENVYAVTTQAQFPAEPKLEAFTTYLNRAFGSRGFNYTDKHASQMILFEMYYQTDDIRVISKIEKITIDQLISNLGGALGLWTGLSLLTMFQAVVYFCSCVCRMMMRLCKKIKCK
jgi:hypothetical protein